MSVCIVSVDLGLGVVLWRHPVVITCTAVLVWIKGPAHLHRCFTLSG